MANKLIKYTKTQNIASDTGLVNDQNNPYTFINWIERNISVIPGKEKIQYENYVKDWYTNKNQEIPTKESVKEDYINLLKQLTVAFKSEADAIWASDINFEDPKEVEQVIPFYASKLKEIAIYLINKREAVRRAKLKYNMTGTYTAIERIFYEYLLKAFTKRQFPGNEYITNVTDVSVLNAMPDLSAVRAGFQITIEELYDNASYFDRDPTLPASAYFTFNNDATAFLDNLNIAPSDYEWLYSTGVSQLCANNPLLWSVDNVINQYKAGIPLSAVELYDSDVLNDYNRIKLTNKYIGEQQYILSGGYWIPWTSSVSYNLVNGNNWFYWLTGENLFENDTSIKYDPLKLIDTNLIDNNATAGLTITASDIVYVNRGDSISGAWLRLIDKETSTPSMSARLNKGRNVFAFPFPGYGVSGEDLAWTGRSFNNLNQTFYYLDKPTQNAVYNEYWNSGLSSVSSFQPIYINDATLIEAGAKAAEKFSEADYIITRPSFKDSAEDYVYTGEQQYAWLYKMAKTDLPIAVGINNLYWPFERYDSNITMVVSSNQCNSISLTALYGVGSVAGIVPETSDKIFKKKSPNATTYLEGAWLSGTILPTPSAITIAGMVSGCYQPNLTMQVLGGSYGSFVWTDGNKLADLVFPNTRHQKDCWYLKQTQFSLYKERPTQEKNINYNQWEECSCRSILYSPLGHPGNNFDEYDGMSDFIISIKNPVSAFDFNTWTGIDEKTYKLSNSFGWFKLSGDNKIEPDVGWGSGNWVNYSGTPFTLSANVMYLYYRSDMHRDMPNSNVPYLITKYQNTNNNTKWVKMYFDKIENRWMDAGISTDMSINPGDILEYTHPETYAFTLTTQRMVINTTPITIPNYDTPTIGAQLNGDVNSLTFTTVLTGASSMVLNSCSAKPVMDYYTYTNQSINFILNVALTNSRPFWAIGSDKDDDYTKRKGIDIWSGSPVLVDEYNFITQPPFSNIKFSDNSYIEYVRRDIGYIVWNQPLNLTVAKEDKKWCKVMFDTNGVSNLSAVLYNNINDIIVSATNIESDLVFDIALNSPLHVNYFARNGFTWTQEISNSSLGLPPTGGVWVPIESEILVIPDAPYAHLSNRHYPTYASAPSVSDLYSVKDSGGYQIPHLLGTSVAISKNVNNILNTKKINNDPTKRGISAIYRDITLFDSDRGLSNTDQNAPVSAISVDSSWMKATIVEGEKAGLVIRAKECQEFMPYQTKYECTSYNDNGLFRQGIDSFDPWFGELDTQWENPIDWPPNWRKQYDIAGWYEKTEINKTVYQWKTDIFGNQYALLKTIYDATSIYDKKHTIAGSVWTRNARNLIQPITTSLAYVLNTVPSGIDISIFDKDNSSILDIDIWADMLMMYTSSLLVFFHLNYDYNTGIISSNSDETNYIITEDSKFGGTWFFEDTKKVTICTLLSCQSQIRPILRSLDLETSQMSYLYNLSSSDTNMTSFTLTSYDNPVFTYDYMTKTYNISYIGYGTQYTGMYVTTINIRDNGEYYSIVNAKTIVPEA